MMKICTIKDVRKEISALRLCFQPWKGTLLKAARSRNNGKIWVSTRTSYKVY